MSDLESKTIEELQKELNLVKKENEKLKGVFTECAKAIDELEGKSSTTSNTPKDNKKGGEGKKKKDKKNNKKNDRKAKRQAELAKNKAKKKDKKDKTAIKSIEIEDKTVPGEKKIQEELPKKYHPKYVESSWYSWWEKQGYFKPDNTDASKPSYTMMLPPPNVTGSLHIGHTLTGAIQDCLVRYKRMKGFNTLYLPGIDHAGIATQIVVEKSLMKKEGKTRHDIGREAFIEKAWEWKEQFGNRITNQLRRTGSSLDWSREAFTMSPELSEAVNTAFVRMYKDGLIYRANRLVNWCCTLYTAISNIEVDRIDLPGTKKLDIPGYDKKIEFGSIWSFKYKIADLDEYITIATTRPETILGDTALAIHPDNPKYKHLHGKFAIHPFNGRKIPIVLDEMAEIDKGTGAMKVTPAHDPKDFDMGKRHNLEFINILNDDGTLNENGAPFEGMKRYDARYAVIKALTDKGLFVEKQSKEMNVGINSRSKDVIEPVLKPQWFVNCDELAKQAMKVVEDGELQIVPEREIGTWNQWLGNIRPWCISRQLWWGHRIPAYKVEIDGNVQQGDDGFDYWAVAETKDEAIKEAKAKFNIDDASRIKLTQDEDVLDTWFSSGLFPFSTLGWPNEENLDFQRFFPNSILETGKDILFFWVARMVMQSLALTKKVPFKTVYLHSMVRDKFNEKMSKSKGNVIDPIHCIQGAPLSLLEETIKAGNLPDKEIKRACAANKKQFPKGIPECGTDALRFSLLDYTGQASDIALDIERVFSYRTFCNKIWQAHQFAFEFYGARDLTVDSAYPTVEPSKMHPISQWIMDGLNTCIEKATKALDEYMFNDYTQSLYDFFKRQFCDIYLEVIKNFDQDSSDRADAKLVLFTVLDNFYRLIHPTMPFITEELWQTLPGRQFLPKDQLSIMVAPYPEVNSSWANADISSEITQIYEVVKALRSIKSDYNISAKKPKLFLITQDATFTTLLTKYTAMVLPLTNSNELEILEVFPEEEGMAKSVINDMLQSGIILKGLINFEEEIVKLNKSLAKKEKRTKSLSSTLSRPQIPDHVREKTQEEHDRLVGEVAQIQKTIQDYQAMI